MTDPSSYDPRCLDRDDGHCSKPGGPITRGLCEAHRGRRTRNGTPLPDRSEYRDTYSDPACLDRANNRCSKLGSKIVRGLCPAHYWHRIKNGISLPVIEREKVYNPACADNGDGQCSEYGNEKRGFCSIHYRRRLKNGTLLRRSEYDDPACADSGNKQCSKPGGRITRGLCRSHYRGKMRSGALPVIQVRDTTPRYEPRCSDNGDSKCSKPGGKMRSGLCEVHYKRRSTNGTLPGLLACEICGGPLNSSNVWGICQRTPACRMIRARRMKDERDRRDLPSLETWLEWRAVFTPPELPADLAEKARSVTPLANNKQRLRVAEILGGLYGICHVCLRVRNLNLDHDHDTGLCRGMVCPSCNTTLGHPRPDRHPVYTAYAANPPLAGWGLLYSGSQTYPVIPPPEDVRWLACRAAYYADEASSAELAAKHGVIQDTMSPAIYGRRWKHLSMPENAKKYCAVCGGPIAQKNKIGICRRTPECGRARQLADRKRPGRKEAQAKRDKARDADPERKAARERKPRSGDRHARKREIS